MKLTGIDVSYHQGVIDWAKVKGNVDFAIIRTGYGKSNVKQVDQQFENNHKGCVANSIPAGAYHYSYAKSVSEAIEEANFVLDIIKGKAFQYPIFFDIEEETQVKLGKTICEQMVTAFCTTLEKANYFAGVYSFDSFFGTNLSDEIPKRFCTWVARVENVEPKICKDYAMWQYSWKGKINGISGDVDMNYCYRDLPSVITGHNLNNT